MRVTSTCDQDTEQVDSEREEEPQTLKVPWHRTGRAGGVAPHASLGVDWLMLSVQSGNGLPQSTHSFWEGLKPYETIIQRIAEIFGFEGGGEVNEVKYRSDFGTGGTKVSYILFLLASCS